jgi:ribosome-binding factor A
METQRQKKVARLLQKDLGEIVSNLVRDRMTNVMVTVTKVIPTSDFSIAKVYFSLFTVADKQQILKEITKYEKEIRHQLGNRIRHQLRIVPELLFFEDDTLDYMEKIDSLLQQ